MLTKEEVEDLAAQWGQNKLVQEFFRPFDDGKWEDPLLISTLHPMYLDRCDLATKGLAG